VAAEGRLDGDDDQEGRATWRTAGRKEPQSRDAIGREELCGVAATTNGGGGPRSPRRRGEPDLQSCGGAPRRTGGLILGSIGVDSGSTLWTLFLLGSTRSEPDVQIRSGSHFGMGRPAPLAGIVARLNLIALSHRPHLLI
jgi:hypothetical protein